MGGGGGGSVFGPCFDVHTLLNVLSSFSIILTSAFLTVPWCVTLVNVNVNLVVFTRIAGTS